MNTVEDLRRDFSRRSDATSTGVAFETSVLGGPVAELSHAGSRATVALWGGQVLSWIPAGGTEALWLSPVARLDGKKAVRGGIPVCWPWFAAHPTDPDRSAHGFVRTADWIVVATEAGPAGARIVLRADPAAAPAGDPAREASLEMTVTLDDRLGLVLATSNAGHAPIEITEALHTYFAVGEISRASIIGLDGHDYLDKLDADQEKPQRGPIHIDREVDRIYLGPAPHVSILDRSLSRRIDIHGEGSRATVVWNPWIDKARRLGDMGETGWRQMLCIETANAGPARVTVAPGTCHRLAVSYRVSRLA